MKKPFVRSPLESLSLHVKQQIAAWLTTGGPHGQGITYEAAKAKLFEAHGVKFSTNALHQFYRRHTRPAAVPVATADVSTPPVTPLATVSVNRTQTTDGRTVTLTLVITLQPLQT